MTVAGRDHLHHIKPLTLGKMQNPVRGFLHGTAAVVSVVGAVSLWLRSSGDLSRQMALLIFGVSLVALYTVSSLYHSVPWCRVWKERMQRLDHCMIYILIAGTYSPISLIVLDGWLRSATLATVWGIALIGIVQKALLPRVGDWFSITMSTAQGWLGLLLIVPLAQRLPWPGFLLLVVGGILYTTGLVSLITLRPRLWPRVFSHHELFHLFVVAGSGTHYAMMFWYVAPLAGT
jgi:hemolysin III